MKLLLFYLLLITSVTAASQEVDGYYLAKNGDTVRGKIIVPMNPKVKIGASSQTLNDPLKDHVDESKNINYNKLTFDFKFAESDGKFKKVDRLKVKGFGFFYENRLYEFETWDVKGNRQIYMIQPTGDVAPDGVYFILKSVNGALPVYSLFQEVEMTKRDLGGGPGNAGPGFNRKYDGYASKRDVIFKHPSKGYIYISDQYPLLMKLPDALKYLEFEDEFIKTLTKKENLLEIVLKYNQWKSNQSKTSN